jgi:hypothetical protein
VEEALHNLQIEREHRMALKRELEALKNAEHMMQLNSMFTSMAFESPSDNNTNGSDALKRLESSFHGGRPGRQRANSNDLFSELNGGDLQVSDAHKSRNTLFIGRPRRRK